MVVWPDPPCTSLCRYHRRWRSVQTTNYYCLHPTSLKLIQIKFLSQYSVPHSLATKIVYWAVTASMLGQGRVPSIVILHSRQMVSGSPTTLLEGKWEEDASVWVIIDWWFRHYTGDQSTSGSRLHNIRLGANQSTTIFFTNSRICVKLKESI